MFLRNCWVFSVPKSSISFNGKPFLFDADVLKVVLFSHPFGLLPNFHIPKLSFEWCAFRFAFSTILFGIFRKRSLKIFWRYALVSRIEKFMLNRTEHPSCSESCNLVLVISNPRWSGQSLENQSKSIRFYSYDLYFLVIEFVSCALRSL